MTNVTRHPSSGGGRDDSQVITGDDYDRLWRAQRAIALLALVDNDTAGAAGINHDATAAVAEYIRDDMLEILNHSLPPDEV